MARKAQKNNKKENNFKEFEMKGQEFIYTGRIYPTLKKSTDSIDITPLSITLNGMITIKGCKLMQTDEASWISFPQYKDNNGDYKSYVYVDREFADKELFDLVGILEKLISE